MAILTIMGLEDREIEILQEAVELRKQFATPGLNGGEITDKVIETAHYAKTLGEKITSAIGAST